MSSFDQKNQQVGDQFNAARDIHIGSNTSTEECPICGKLNLPHKTFRCKRCERASLCVRHQDKNLLICTDCVHAIEAEQREISRQLNEATGGIETVWVDFGVNRFLQTGMTIHTTMNINNMLGQKCYVTAYFYHPNGQPLRDTNGSYSTVDGHVSVGSDLVPPYSNTQYPDFQLFIPNAELHLDISSKGLYFHVSVIAGLSSRLLAQSPYFYFDHISQRSCTGSVKWFDINKGYGFIIVDETLEEVFVHVSHVAVNNIFPGQRVQFIIVEGKKGHAAEQVRLLT